jgi:pre-rRNA-processing protein TSR3
MVYEFRQDDPRKCTSAKLRRFHLATRLPKLNLIPAHSIVLNPESPTTLSRDDRESVKRHGIVALDCSWNRAEDVLHARIPGQNRRLPSLLAGNPTNYGTPELLSTAEALAAALYITGFHLESEKLLSIFKWGGTFLSLNQSPLDAYSECPRERIFEKEQEYFRPQKG